MKKAAVVIDDYKLKIFKRNLKNAGFDWKETPFTKNVKTLTVFYDPSDFDALLKIVKESNEQGRR